MVARVGNRLCDWGAVGTMLTVRVITAVPASSAGTGATA